MTIEEKAKRYDEAIEVARKIKNGEPINVPDGTLIPVAIFPELKESGGERIRKALIRYFTLSDEHAYNEAYGVSYRDIVAWLEKQGQTFTKKDVDDAYLKGVCDTKQELEKQVKQPKQDNSDVKDYNNIDPHFGKPVDKVEPKFKVGDYIISNNNSEIIYHITGTCINELGNPDYVCEHVGREKEYNGRIYNMRQYKVDANFRLWTIQDAKDGDVLVTLGCILIFEKLLPKGGGVSYCHYDFVSSTPQFDFTKDHNWYFGKEAKVYPATKEQRDALEKIMADAGYTFDFEKKELKKIEQKSAESNDIKSVLLVHDEILNNLLERYKTSATFKTLIVNLQNWWNNTRRHLLSFNIEQKNAWNKEDEEMLLSAIEYVCTFSAYRNSVVDWLKSLKDRYTWKPSDEQMEALEHFVRSVGESGYASPYDNNTKLLYSLLSDLRKLKE